MQGAAGRAIDLTFVVDPEPYIHGFSGCNMFRSTYRLEGETISLGPIASTMMACPEGMDVEQRFLAMLDRVARYRQSDNRLELCDAEGDALATFEATSEVPS